MIHKKCRHQLQLDLSSMYTLRSPSIVITTRGISPGMVEINASDKKKSPILCCPSCEETFSSREEYEDIIEECAVCHDSHPVSKIFVTDFIPRICEDCLSRDISTMNRNSMEYKYLSIYGEMLNKKEFPTLLTLLMKKI